MGSSDDYARMRSLEYGAALRDVGLEPGDIAQLTCPSCSATFGLELPAVDPDVVRSHFPVIAGELFVTCANHCFTHWSFADFQPRLTATPSSVRIENEHCTRYWTDSPASRCPLCGIENYREVLTRQVLKVHALGAMADDGAGGVAQDAAIDATKDMVAIFDGVMRAMVSGHAANLAHSLSQLEQTAVIESFAASAGGGLTTAEAVALWPGSISFQNLSGARKNILQATCSCDPWHKGEQVKDCLTGSDIEKWISNELGPDAWRTAVRVFEKRHVYQHGLGAADSHYIGRTGDQTVRIGQLVPIGTDELDMTARACALVGNRFFAAFLS